MLSVLTAGKKKKSRKRKKETGPPWWPSGSVPACRCRGHRLSPPVDQYLPADAGDTGSRGSVPACRCRGHRLSPPVGQYLPADAGDTGSLPVWKAPTCCREAQPGHRKLGFRSPGSWGPCSITSTAAGTGNPHTAMKTKRMN